MSDNRQFQNIQDIRQSHEVNQEYHQKLESGIDSKKKKISWGENLEGYLSGDVLSPLLFQIPMMPISHIHRKCTGEYNLHKSQEQKQNIHLLYMDDIKLFANDNIGVEFGIEKVPC